MRPMGHLITGARSELTDRSFADSPIVAIFNTVHGRRDRRRWVAAHRIQLWADNRANLVHVVVVVSFFSVSLRIPE